MMVNYLVDGDRVSVISAEAMTVSTTLPPNIYTVVLEHSKPPMLKKLDEFTVPDILYGDVSQKTDKVIQSFKRRKTSTGVLMVGAKGSGKSLLARNIALTLLRQGVPTIVVPHDIISATVSDFIDSIDTECVVLFDEFDKATRQHTDEYGNSSIAVPQVSDSLLSLFDGISPRKKLYILTANDIDRVNKQLLNRPGRVYYRFEFNGLDESAIRSYCAEQLKDQTQVQDIITIASLVHQFSFDMLKALVEECNSFHIEPKEACKVLNIAPELSGDFKITVRSKDTGHECWVDPASVYRTLNLNDSVATTRIYVIDTEPITKSVGFGCIQETPEDVLRYDKHVPEGREVRLLFSDAYYTRVVDAKLEYDVIDPETGKQYVVSCLQLSATSRRAL
jgi:hypothetical protein